MGATDVTAAGRVSKADGIRARQALTQREALPAIRLSDGTVEGLKWIGLMLMTFDHVNKYLLHDAAPALFAVGRLAMPTFGLVLAYNLARPRALERGVYERTLGRLALVGVVAEVPFIALGGLGWGWWPFNILGMLFVAATVMWLVELGGRWRFALAVVVFVIGGALVEFWWPAIAMCLAAWSYCRRPNWWALTFWVASVLALWVINRNWWALAAFPLIFYAPHAHWRLPRWRYAFYAYYPAHLTIIWGVSVWFAIPRAGGAH